MKDPRLEDSYVKVDGPKTVHVNLTGYSKVKARYGTCVYELDIEALLKQFGNLVEIINNEKSE